MGYSPGINNSASLYRTEGSITPGPIDRPYRIGDGVVYTAGMAVKGMDYMPTHEQSAGCARAHANDKPLAHKYLVKLHAVCEIMTAKVVAKGAGVSECCIHNAKGGKRLGTKNYGKIVKFLRSKERGNGN